MNPLKIGSLFAGIGGFDLAARWMGWETKWYSEIDPYACRVMEKHFGEAYNVGDITKWPPAVRDTVDIVCGGFPCQPVSLAGKRQAQDDERWLWPEFARVLGILRPRYVVIENVPGLRSRGMGDVLRDLSKIGYDAEWTSLSAADVGAPHKRERVWIVAYPNPGRELQPQGRVTDQRGRTSDGGGEVADAPSINAQRPPHRQGQVQPRGSGWWLIEPDVGRVAHGVPSRVDRLKCLGNAIVPQCAYEIFKCIESGRVERWYF